MGPESTTSPTVSARPSRGRFSPGVCFAGLAFLGLAFVFGLVTGYFLAWGVGEGEGAPLAQGLATIVLLGLCGYIVAVAPRLWVRSGSTRGRLTVLAPHGLLLVAGVAGLAFG